MVIPVQVIGRVVVAVCSGILFYYSMRNELKRQRLLDYELAKWQRHR